MLSSRLISLATVQLTKGSVATWHNFTDMLNTRLHTWSLDGSIGNKSQPSVKWYAAVVFTFHFCNSMLSMVIQKKHVLFKTKTYRYDSLDWTVQMQLFQKTDLSMHSLYNSNVYYYFQSAKALNISSYSFVYLRHLLWTGCLVWFDRFNIDKYRISSTIKDGMIHKNCCHW